MRLATSSGMRTRRATLNRLRYAPPLPSAAVHNAIVFVAFAGIGGTPVNSNAGKAMKLPPPATEFSAPPSTPATNSTMAYSSVKKIDVSEKDQPRHSGNLYLSIVTCVMPGNPTLLAETTPLRQG
jgi:hypothetical protein